MAIQMTLIKIHDRTKSISSIGCGISSMCAVLGQSVSNGSDISSTNNSGTNWTNQFDTNLYSYDQDGHLLNLQDGIGTTNNITYSYDPLGRLTSQVNEYNVSTSYTYDLVSNMTGLTYPNGQSVTRVFNGANELTSVTTWLPGVGTCGTYSIPNDTTSFTYDLNGNLTNLIYMKLAQYSHN